MKPDALLHTELISIDVIIVLTFSLLVLLFWAWCMDIKPSRRVFRVIHGVLFLGVPSASFLALMLFGGYPHDHRAAVYTILYLGNIYIPRLSYL